MLRFFTILMLFCFASNANAQTYIPFPTSADTVIWLEKAGIVTSGPPNFFETFIEGDTIINNKIYSKIYSTPYGGTMSYYRSSMREEGKIVYVWDDSVDVVLYDFNAQVGDTIFWFGAYVDEIPYIQSIDSVNIDGMYRKRYYINTQSSGFSVIEGIGSDTGLFPQYSYFEGYVVLICFTLNNKTIYTEPNNPNCIVSTKQIQQTDNISINPNPTSDFLNIDFETNEERTFRLFNQLGQVVLSEISNDAQLILNVAHLPKGFYVLAIQTEKGTFTKKIIKE